MSSQSKSTSNQQSTTKQQDNRAVVDGGATAITGTGGNVTITQSDMGLVSAAFDYFTNKDALAAAQTRQQLDMTASGLNAVVAAGSSFLDKAATAADPAAQQSRLEMMMMGLAALALFFMLKGAR